jgi:hypothetical protein
MRLYLASKAAICIDPTLSAPTQQRYQLKSVFGKANGNPLKRARISKGNTQGKHVTYMFAGLMLLRAALTVDGRDRILVARGLY